MDSNSMNCISNEKQYGPTFVIRVDARHNSTWQGEIQWLERRQARRFRSLLELILMVNEAIDMNSGTPDNSRTWRNS